MRSTFITAVVASTFGLAQARFWWDGYGFRVFGYHNPPNCSVSVCSTDEAVGCVTVKCTPREDVKAIAADTWFTADWEDDYWYRGPTEGAWLLKDIVDGKEDWQWIQVLNPIPKEVLQNDQVHVINHGIITF